MYIFKKQLKKGYSLVETIIYLAIFTFISIFVINSFITIMSSFWVTNYNRNILESGITSLERITREIRQAESIDTINTTSTNLVLNGEDESGNPRTVRFTLSDGAINFYENGNLLGDLTHPDTIISNLSFTRISNTESEAVKIQMTISSDGSNIERSENFYSTIILRGSY